MVRIQISGTVWNATCTLHRFIWYVLAWSLYNKHKKMFQVLCRGTRKRSLASHIITASFHFSISFAFFLSHFVCLVCQCFFSHVYYLPLSVLISPPFFSSLFCGISSRWRHKQHVIDTTIMWTTSIQKKNRNCIHHICYPQQNTPAIKWLTYRHVLHIMYDIACIIYMLASRKWLKHQIKRMWIWCFQGYFSFENSSHFCVSNNHHQCLNGL